MGWTLVMFDLPTTTPEEQKRASSFRKFLLDDGYTMTQYSVYARSCLSYEVMEKHAKRLTQRVPEGGNVKAFFITDKQWEKSICCLSPDYQRKKKYIKPQQQDLFAVW